MAIRTYNDDENTKRYEVYVNVRSKKIPTLRIQKRRKGISSQAEALRIEKKYLKEIVQEIAHREGTSSIWRVVIGRWEFDAKQGYFSDLSDKTIDGIVNTLKKWTESWLELPCEDLNRGHGKKVLREALDSGLSKSHTRKIKCAINTVYNYGIEEGIIKGVTVSPVHNLQFKIKQEDKIKEILTLEECQRLLSEAQRLDHAWYHVWAMALNTGCRNGELYALRKESIDFELGLIRITNSWDFLNERLKPTKKSYWRNVPISEDLKKLLLEIMEANPDGEFLLPRLKEWQGREQAKVLREFCNHIGIPSVRFHTLRACFATHLLAAGVEPSVVRLIGGWKDIKSFQIYIRLSGISEKGATEKLQFLTSPTPKKTDGTALSIPTLIKKEAA